jgi:hypothetical protein
MKKGIVIGLAVVGLTLLGSCKKEYTCDCTGSTESVDYHGILTIKTTKGKAADACAAESGPALGGVDRVCVLVD